jgi:bifunctional non-homologous end joining protein LigD
VALELYRKKRDFRTTPEPRGRAVRSRKRELSFVIQKHRASRLHYDFRLELNGVLLSWAVPKGPSLDPGVKRLAMHVEDHPIEYGEFEGVIPPRQYGSGTVLLWDRGTWRPKEDPAAGYRRGRLKFELNGKKLRGGWMLVRSHSRQYGNGDGDKAWLLFKEKDDYARPSSDASVVDDEPASVASGRTLEEIAADADRVWQSSKSVAANVKAGAIRRRKAKPRQDPARVPGARKAAIPDFVAPPLATLVKESPSGADWVHEIKHDGYRMVCRVEEGEVRMFSRNGNEWTSKFPGIARALARLPVRSAWIDGEVVALQSNGVSSFQALQNALSSPRAANLHFYAFDLSYLDGHDLRRAPLVERKRILERLLAGAPDPIRYSPHIQGSGRDFYEEGCRLKLEGVIAKLADSPYLSGRNRAWLKVKCIQRQEMVIGGYTDPEGARTGLGALLLGVYEPGGKLRYSGRVGTGFNERTLKDLRSRLGKLEQDSAPFYNPPGGWEARGAHWVKPELVGEVAFTEWTNEGTLRHPSFQGLRLDKKPRDVVRETPAAPPDERGKKALKEAAASKPAARARGPRRAQSPTRAKHGAEIELGGIRLTNPDKPLYPESGITKRDLAAYYQAVARWILPHLEQRPLSLVRCPNGWQKQCFFQKNADNSTSEALDRVKVRTSEGPASYMMANSAEALTALTQMGVLEIHPWGSTARKQGCPDRIIFDIDPGEDVEWGEVAEAARAVNGLLEELGLQSFLKTTGGKGLHVVVPILPRLPWDDIKGFSKAIADLFARTFPDRFTANMAKAKRRGKIFIDYLRNGEGATAVCAYSTRARERAPVAVPLAWKELGGRDVRFDHFHVGNVPQRLERLKSDPWDGFFDMRQSVTQAMVKKVGYKR